MFNRISFSEPLQEEPPSIDPTESIESVWLVSLVPPRVLNRDSMKPSQVFYCNYWLHRWGCTTRFLTLEHFDEWLEDYPSARQIPDSQS